MKKVFLVAAAAFCLAACKKKAPENIPQPKADEPVAASTAAPVGLLDMPGAYVKSNVAKIDKAREAAAVYEKTAKETLGAASEVGAGGGD